MGATHWVSSSSSSYRFMGAVASAKGEGWRIVVELQQRGLFWRAVMTRYGLLLTAARILMKAVGACAQGPSRKSYNQRSRANSPGVGSSAQKNRKSGEGERDPIVPLHHFRCAPLHTSKARSRSLTVLI
jgi:hypothetical protein